MYYNEFLARYSVKLSGLSFTNASAMIALPNADLGRMNPGYSRWRFLAPYAMDFHTDVCRRCDGVGNHLLQDRVALDR